MRRIDTLSGVSNGQKHICRYCDNEVGDPREQLCDECKIKDVLEEFDQRSSTNDFPYT
jgi:RecJ-like exonuclease